MASVSGGIASPARCSGAIHTAAQLPVSCCWVTQCRCTGFQILLLHDGVVRWRGVRMVLTAFVPKMDEEMQAVTRELGQ
jgi:hypothetical protein